MQAHVLDREARARRFVQKILADLRLLGYTDAQLRGKGIEQLLRMHSSGFTRLMSEAPAPRAA